MSTSTIAKFPAVYHFESGATSLNVNKERGVIYGVSLITSGITAKGHDLEVDGKTLEQMLSCAEKKGKIPVKWNHKTGADAVSGYLKNFRIEGKKLVGDWHLLKSHERFAHALELASEMPECLGLSTSFRGEDEAVGERKFARCTELVSADLVASPAANPDGFFEEKIVGADGAVDSPGNDMADKKQSNGAASSSQENKEFSLADVMAGISQINQRIDGIEEKVTSFESFQDEVARAFNEEPDDEEENEEGAEGEEGGETAERQSRRTEFSSGDEALQYLHEKLLSIEDAKESAKIERAFAAYDSKVESLIELNEQLALENAAMAEALVEFQEATGREIQFSASAEGGYEHHLAETAPDGRKLTEFEARCKQFEKDGKSETEAITLAMKEDPKRYQKHLQSLGVLNRTL
jgi:hypothetical protein